MADINRYYLVQVNEGGIWCSAGETRETLEQAQVELYKAWDSHNGEYECRIQKVIREIIQTLPTKEEFYKKVGDPS